MSYDWGDRLPTLTGPRVELRWLEETDIPALFEIFSDPEVMRYWSSPPLPDLAAAGETLRALEDGKLEVVAGGATKCPTGCSVC